jgi:hypothetical protein
MVAAHSSRMAVNPIDVLLIGKNALNWREIYFLHLNILHLKYSKKDRNSKEIDINLFLSQKKS